MCYGWLSVLFRGWVHSSIGHSSCLFPCWTQLNRADRSQVFSIMSTEDKGPTNQDSADYDDDLERGSLFQEEGENQARGLRPTGLYEVDESRFLGRIGQIIDDKLRGFSSQKPKYEFKRKGNEKQFEVNEQVSKLLFSAKSALSEVKSVPSAVREPVKRAFSDVSFALDTINHRNKLVKLADSSDAGWTAVTEYETHELASDSEDEKRIFKAEARAMRKIKEVSITRVLFSHT